MQGGVGEGKPSPRFSFGGGWEGGFDQLISSRIYTPEAKASADFHFKSVLIIFYFQKNLTFWNDRSR